MKKLIFNLIVASMLAFLPSVSFAGSININTADTKVLSQLKGVGQKYAERIVQYRNQHGKFETLEDLLKVKGIGSKTLEANREQLILEEPKEKH